MSQPESVALQYVPCDLCGGDDARRLFQARDTLCQLPGTFSVVQCRRCGLAYLNPRPSLQALAACYPAGYFNELGSLGNPASPLVRRFYDIYRLLAGGLARKIERLPPGRVLDVGCGDGRYLAFFRERGWEAYGVDPSPVAIERARGLGLAVRLGELIGAGYPGDYFDLAVMRYTIENIHNPTAVLREVMRVLKAGGRLFLAAPCFSSPVSRVFQQYSAYVDAPRHLYFFNRQTLSSLLEKVGLEVVEFAWVAWTSLFRDVFNRMTGGRFKGALANLWVSRAVWLGSVPPALVLAYLGLNRGNMEVVAEKRRQ